MVAQAQAVLTDAELQLVARRGAGPQPQYPQSEVDAAARRDAKGA